MVPWPDDAQVEQDLVTLPERLKEAGYVSGISGKAQTWRFDTTKGRGSGVGLLPVGDL
jgi:hypothetical protein